MVVMLGVAASIVSRNRLNDVWTRSHAHAADNNLQRFLHLIGAEQVPG